MRTICLSLIVVLAACKSDPLAKDKNVAGWANASSAFGAFSGVYDPIGFATGDFTFNDAACPATTDNGTTATITGGCTDSDGTRWEGTATVVRGAGGMLSVTFDGYGDDGFV